MNVVRVLPDVTGLDRHFDYALPDSLAHAVRIGTRVRVPLHGRRIGGWVLEVGAAPDVGAASLKEVTRVTGLGPAPEVVDLAGWAAWRWAGRRRVFLTAASPRTAVAALPPARRTHATPSPASPATTALLHDLAMSGRTTGVLRLPPTSDPLPCVFSAVRRGPTVVVVPELAVARLTASRLRRAGLTVAVIPDEWSAAASGVDVVIGARTAAWAPCPDLAAAVVLDEHDEALQSESSPTWHARDVLVERCRRAGVPLVLVSPCPTLHALALADPMHPSGDRERRAWPILEVVDRSDDVPWRRSLLTSELIQHLRAPDRRVVCVSNTTGRARLLACRSCRSLARCEYCDAAVALDDNGRLVCPACSTARPPVCASCGASAFANLRPGVTRLREELEAAAGRPVARVTGEGTEGPDDAAIHVGTEAVLHRIPSADVVAFLDVDRELLAPRFRAAEQAMALFVRAARMVGPRGGGGRILVQTFLPEHPVIRAVLLGDPSRIVPEERTRRALLGLPPVRAVASVSGAGADAYVASLVGVEVGGAGGNYLVRADGAGELADALRAGSRPPSTSLRIAVDPPRV